MAYIKIFYRFKIKPTLVYPIVFVVSTVDPPVGGGVGGGKRWNTSCVVVSTDGEICRSFVNKRHWSCDAGPTLIHYRTYSYHVHWVPCDIGPMMAQCWADAVQALGRRRFNVMYYVK